MIVRYRNNKLEKSLTDCKLLKRTYGHFAKKIMMRMNDLINAYENLGEVPALPPQRRHKLTNYSSAHTIKGFDYFSIIIDVNYRIVFHAIPPEIPLGEHGEMLLGQIKEIKIIEIVDYHD